MQNNDSPMENKSDEFTNTSSNNNEYSWNIDNKSAVGNLSTGTLVDILNSKAGIFLPTTASAFPTLMLRRNGPYGFSSFNEIRVGQNPCTRRQRQHNLFTHVVEPGVEVGPVGNIPAFTNRYGEIKLYKEPAIVSKYKPIELKVISGVRQRENNFSRNSPFIVKTSFANNTNHFSNPELNKYYGKLACTDDGYEKIKKCI